MKHRTTYRCTVSFGRLSSGIWDMEVTAGNLLWQTTFLPGATVWSLEATVDRSRWRFEIVQRQPAGQLYTPSATTLFSSLSNRYKTAAGSFIITRLLANATTDQPYMQLSAMTAIISNCTRRSSVYTTTNQISSMKAFPFNWCTADHISWNRYIQLCNNVVITRIIYSQYIITSFLPSKSMTYLS